MRRLWNEGYRSYLGRSARYAPIFHRSKPCRKAAVELAEVSSTHSTEEVVNHHGGKGWTIRSCVKSKVCDCVWKQLLYGDWMAEGRLETESRCQECLAIIKGEITSNNLSKRRVRTRTHGVVGGRGLVAPSYPIIRLTDEKNPSFVINQNWPAGQS